MKICKAIKSLIQRLLSTAYWEEVTTVNRYTIPFSPSPMFWTVEYTDDDPLLNRRLDIRDLSTDALQQQMINISHNPTISEEQKKLRRFKIAIILEERLLRD